MQGAAIAEATKAFTKDTLPDLQAQEKTFTLKEMRKSH